MFCTAGSLGGTVSRHASIQPTSDGEKKKGEGSSTNQDGAHHRKLQRLETNPDTSQLHGTSPSLSIKHMYTWSARAGREDTFSFSFLSSHQDQKDRPNCDSTTPKAAFFLRQVQSEHPKTSKWTFEIWLFLCLSGVGSHSTCCVTPRSALMSERNLIFWYRTIWDHVESWFSYVAFTPVIWLVLD